MGGCEQILRKVAAWVRTGSQFYSMAARGVPGEGHKIYPYLLEGVEVNRVNQVWSTDITYIRMTSGFVYLVAVMDRFSRFVLSWALSVTMEVPFCIEALEKTLRWGKPEVFNSDQGSQFTSEKFIGVLKERDIAVGMDGRGRCLDNLFIERLWRSLKYEEVYLRDYRLVPEARAGIRRYFQFYNYERSHQSLEYRTPASTERADLPSAQNQSVLRDAVRLEGSAAVLPPRGTGLSARHGDVHRQRRCLAFPTASIPGPRR
jgi:putative transposase